MMHQIVRPAALAALCVVAYGCAPQSSNPTTEPQPPGRAERLARSHLIIDTHIDVPFRLQRQASNVAVSAPDGQFDYPRARTGGLNAPFMSIYTPASVDESGEAFAFAEQAIDVVQALAAVNPDEFALATCTADLQAQFKRGLISLPMGMENGGPIDHKLNNLEHFFNRGVRYITLAHSKSNHLSDSSYDRNEAWGGLSPFGKQIIPQMNRLGVMVDVSHLSDKAFWQVLELSATPVLATHSSMRHFTPGFQRNMSDEMVAALAARGGVIQINFGSGFLHQPARDFAEARTLAAKEYQLANHLPDSDPALMQFLIDYRERHPYPYASLDIVLDHIDRAVQVGGIDAVGIGSDYDGVGDSLPDGLKDVASYPNLIRGLMARGYGDQAIIKILGGNTLRVWQAAEDFARRQGTETRCVSS